MVKYDVELPVHLYVPSKHWDYSHAQYMAYVVFVIKIQGFVHARQAFCQQSYILRLLETVSTVYHGFYVTKRKK